MLVSDPWQKDNKEKLEKIVYLLGNFARCWQSLFLGSEAMAERTLDTFQAGHRRRFYY